MPGVKADRRIEALYRTSRAVAAAASRRCPRSRPGPLRLLEDAVVRRSCGPAYAYIGYLLLDLLLLPQRRLDEVDPQRLGRGLHARLRRLGAAEAGRCPRRSARAALAGAPRRAPASPTSTSGAASPSASCRGSWLAALLELGALYLAPTPLGPHLALPLFCAAYAWEERSGLLALLRADPRAPTLSSCRAWLGGGVELLPHAIAGLLAWGLVRFLPHGGGSGSADREEPVEAPSSTLGLRD